MIGFFDTAQIGLIALNDIVGVEPARTVESGEEFYMLRLQNGVSFDLPAEERAALLWRPVQLIPAEPWTRMISVDGAEEGAPTFRARVIAWALCADGATRPVTPNGVCNGDPVGFTHYVEMADGSIEGVGEYPDPTSFVDAAAMAAYFAGKKRHSLDPDL